MDSPIERANYIEERTNRYIIIDCPLRDEVTDASQRRIAEIEFYQEPMYANANEFVYKNKYQIYRPRSRQASNRRACE